MADSKKIPKGSAEGLRVRLLRKTKPLQAFPIEKQVRVRPPRNTFVQDLPRMPPRKASAYTCKKELFDINNCIREILYHNYHYRYH